MADREHLSNPGVQLYLAHLQPDMPNSPISAPLSVIQVIVLFPLGPIFGMVLFSVVSEYRLFNKALFL